MNGPEKLKPLDFIDLKSQYAALRACSVLRKGDPRLARFARAMSSSLSMIYSLIEAAANCGVASFDLAAATLVAECRKRRSRKRHT